MRREATACVPADSKWHSRVAQWRRRGTLVRLEIGCREWSRTTTGVFKGRWTAVIRPGRGCGVPSSEFRVPSETRNLHNDRSRRREEADGPCAHDFRFLTSAATDRGVLKLIMRNAVNAGDGARRGTGKTGGAGGSCNLTKPD